MASWIYDVFLSFRGEDTRNSFTSHLYEALAQAGINAFKDSEELKRGIEISQEIREAIDGSRILVVVFSKNYASSTWCLEELRIMGCMERPNGQMVLPVFYDVDPSQVQKQDFGGAFTQHEETFKEDLEKVQKWRRALTKAANISGWHLNHRSESTLIKDIVQDILTKINRTLLTIAKNPVGIDFHIQQLKSALGLELDDVRMIGIYGLGGIGKTTIAKAIYNLIANRFDGCSFLPSIKEKCGSSMHDGLVKLQELLLQDILLDKMHWSINFVDRGTNILRERLRKKKVLIVLDDVDNILHLEKLAGNGDWFGRGSRVIITTRNKQLLDAHGIYWTYKVDELNHEDALELFCWNAFKKPHPNVNFEELSDAVVRYADGHPLALTVVGASLCGCSKAQWESELQKLRRIPKKDVHEMLKLSFDGLDDVEKTIFLDIACFFKGEEVGRVMSFLDACGFYPDSGIEVLKKKCLIYSEEMFLTSTFQMHDMIQLMGREIVRQESPFDLGRRSRLWFHEDVLQLLNENEGTLSVQGIYLNMPNVEVSLQTETFLKMKKLRLLIIREANVIGTPQYLSNELRWLEWPAPSSMVPSTFRANKLVVLNLQRCSIKKFEIGLKGFENLRYLNFNGCKMLTEICDISVMPNLVSLDLQRCSNLEFFSSGLKSKFLKDLNLDCCYKLKKFPDILEEMECLDTLSLRASGITELPASIENLTGLIDLNLDSCEHLVRLPSSIYRLKNVRFIVLDGCFRLETFPQPLNSVVVSSSSEGKRIQDSMTCLDNRYHSTLAEFRLMQSNFLKLDFIMAFNCFNSLRSLHLNGSKIRRLPRGMSKFEGLELIILKSCKQLQDIQTFHQISVF
ncbi:TMV resistance protein N-like [Momordica charantia]|uniref:ADP-ribosyl cyclase/cyclic ADP-ribose hydrolase n=1 Tax=Momordica charantia TaxID=3673 RepID=A0A6J1D4F5_MOMCH|nr:TMV resistance protein N-like [Momordica charantia]